MSLHLYPTDDDDINRMGEKVVLREQVKELFNKKYGEKSRIVSCETLGHESLTYWIFTGSTPKSDLQPLETEISLKNMAAINRSISVLASHGSTSEPL